MKQMVRHETVSETTASRGSIELPDAVSRGEISNTTTMVDLIPKVGGSMAPPINFADGTHQHKSSLVVKLKLGQ